MNSGDNRTTRSEYEELEMPQEPMMLLRLPVKK